MTLDYSALVDELLQKGTVESDDWSARRVGRNTVWKLARSEYDSAFYVKSVPTDEWYEREITGLKIAQELAAEEAWSMAPELLFAEPGKRAIVISGLPGHSGNSLIRNAFRIDQNPLRRRGPIEKFERALREVVKWLAAFHRRDYELSCALIDHTYPAVRVRVAGKLRRAVRDTGLSIPEEHLSEFETIRGEDSRGGQSLICGDASLSNFFYDGQRVGRIDFEDLGVGPPERDFKSLQLHLSRITGLPWYWPARGVRKTVGIETNSSKAVLHELEWAVDQHWSQHRRRALIETLRFEHRIRRLLSSLLPASR